MLRFFSALILTSFAALAMAEPPAATDAPTTATVTATPTVNKWAKLYNDRVDLFMLENSRLPVGRKNLVFVGDSITQGFDLPKYFPGYPVLNRGIGSDGITTIPGGPSTRGVTNRLGPSILDTNPAIVFILIGTNDIGQATVPLDYWFDAYERIITVTMAQLPATKIVIQLPPPTGLAFARHLKWNPRKDDFNKRLRQLATKHKLEIVDLDSMFRDQEGLLRADLTGDGLHLRAEAYKMWAAAVMPILQRAGIKPEPVAP